MRYLPHTEEDVAAMLRAIGVGAIEELFSSVPESHRVRGPLDLPDPLTEWELRDHLEALSAATGTAAQRAVFLGAGSYHHHIPASVPSVVRRSEFLTAYTPYQPEVGQGTLQAIYEYQTLVARLLGMEVSNASVYDGASALAEGLLMALRVTRRHKVAISRAVHPSYRRVANTYLGAAGVEVVELPFAEDGRTDLSALDGVDGLGAVATQSPNFFGCVEDLPSACAAAREAGALAVVTFTEALAYGLLRSPGVCGADIACGEGQSLGIPQSFGGPCLGIFTARLEHVRNLPGRLVGKAADQEGRVGYVLTLATREQHIRRERATSNICTNQSLCAVTAAAYLASAGRRGLRDLARLNYDKAEYLKRHLSEAGLGARFPSPTFNEFVVRCPPGRSGLHSDLVERGIVAGLPLEPHYPELGDCLLLCVTETKTRADLDALVEEIRR